MKTKNILLAVIAATLVSTHAQAAEAFSWSWLWFSWDIIAPNNIITPNN